MATRYEPDGASPPTPARGTTIYLFHQVINCISALPPGPPGGRGRPVPTPGGVPGGRGTPNDLLIIFSFLTGAPPMPGRPVPAPGGAKPPAPGVRAVPPMPGRGAPPPGGRPAPAPGGGASSRRGYENEVVVGADCILGLLTSSRSKRLSWTAILLWRLLVSSCFLRDFH